ncbi:MAG: hypothetical protein ACI9O4_000106 [Chitinophagales bacterium]|jgi:hypothetical protein
MRSTLGITFLSIFLIGSSQSSNVHIGLIKTEIVYADFLNVTGNKTHVDFEATVPNLSRYKNRPTVFTVLIF